LSSIATSSTITDRASISTPFSIIFDPDQQLTLVILDCSFSPRDDSNGSMDYIK
jgi:hypothetical protein